MENREITREDVNVYRCSIDDKYDTVNSKEVITLVNAYIRTKQITEGIRFLNTIINNQDFYYLDIEKIKNIKMQVENIQRRQTVRRLIRAGEKMTNIMRQTGLKETEIIQIKRKMEKTTSLKKGTVLGE